MLPAGLADPPSQDVALGLLRLGQQQLESIGRSAGHSIGLASVLADDRPDATGKTIFAAGGRDTKSDDQHRGGSTVPSQARVLVAKGSVPIGPRVHRNGSLDDPERPSRARLRRPAGPLRWPIEEGLDDLADAFILIVVFCRQDEARPAVRAGRAASRLRRLVGQLGHGDAEV